MLKAIKSDLGKYLFYLNKTDTNHLFVCLDVQIKSVWHSARHNNFVSAVC